MRYHFDGVTERFELPHWLKASPYLVAQFFLVTREAVRRVLFEEALSTHAAAIAFYALLSFGPLVLVVLWASSALLSESISAQQALESYIRTIIPTASDELIGQLTSLTAQSTVFGLAGIAGLLWSGSRIFSSVDTALNFIWRVRAPRSYWKGRLLSIALVPVLLVIFFASLIATGLYTRAAAVQIPFVRLSLSDLPLLGDTLAVLAPLVLSVGLFFLAYWFLPARKVPAHSALTGAVVSALLWELAKLGFDLYIRNFGRMDKLYGAAAGLAVLLLWLYYSSLTFLVGAVVGASDTDRRLTVRADEKQREAEFKKSHPG
jgi:membrane protein